LTVPPSWALSDRLAWCKRFRHLLASAAPKLAKLASDEIGKPEPQALASEIMPLLASCRWHERHAKRLLADSTLRARPFWLMGQRHRTRRAPLGTVAIIATWNYPINLLGVQLIQALIAGNRVIVKPSERSPRTQAYLLKLARHAGADEATLRWTEPTREAGPRLLASEHLDHVVFTGSTEVGRLVARVAAERLIPTTLELSGCDSALVQSDADTTLAARSIWYALTLNSGQTCMAPRRVIVSEEAYPSFIAALSFLAAGAKPLPLIDHAARDRALALVNQALSAGARSLLGVIEPPLNADASARPLMRPLVLVDCTTDMPLTQGEHFAPVLSVIRAASDAAAINLHRSYDKKLATSIYTRNTSRARTLAADLSSGVVTINDTILPTAHPAACITGIGSSGWGVSRGVEGVLAMTRPVTVSVTSSRMRIPAEDPDPTAAKMLARLTRWLYARSSVVAPPPDEPTTTATDSSVRHTPNQTSSSTPQGNEIKPHAQPHHAAQDHAS
jgi:acyl-CoA reductase-like NAD-dependent aldehyde dehydrogenase